MPQHTTTAVVVVREDSCAKCKCNGGTARIAFLPESWGMEGGGGVELKSYLKRRASERDTCSASAPRINALRKFRGARPTSKSLVSAREERERESAYSSRVTEIPKCNPDAPHEVVLTLPSYFPPTCTPPPSMFLIIT